ncbi:MAG: bifunctional oligoribonuclease/PAP phosphatase NrnA [Anaerolineales bacterium]|nr:bifunctional oligoribonuclease/PAP phosphatase NrnA [Anaerolineales bacterium]
MTTKTNVEERKVDNGTDGGGEASLETREVAVAKSKAQKLVEILEAHRGERHLIVVHDFPDPDAIAAAFTHRLISAQFDIEADVIYGGKISHQQNIALVRLLGLNLLPFDPALDLSQYQAAVFVDNQGTTAEKITEALEAAGVPCLIVVDHHEVQERLQPHFKDIRRSGAVATIYAKYLEQGLLELDRSNKDHVIAATALMHGLITDTQNFIRANAEDFQAAGFLSWFTDVEILGQIMRQLRPKQVMEIIRRALGERMTVESFSIAGIGYVRAEDRDAIPQAADFLLTEENIHTAIVYGIVVGANDEEKLIGSLRTLKITLDPDEFLKEVFGKDPTGHYFGGGKQLAGGFEIPVGFLSGDSTDEEYRRMKWQVYDAQIKQKLFNKIGVEKG